MGAEPEHCAPDAEDVGECVAERDSWDFGFGDWFDLCNSGDEGDEL